MNNTNEIAELLEDIEERFLVIGGNQDLIERAQTALASLQAERLRRVEAEAQPPYRGSRP